jgi:N-acetylmuramoyl-L-alanine amidase
MNKAYLLITMLLVHMACLPAEQFNHITKIYQHAGNVSDNIVCYFTKDPICNKLPQKPHEIQKKDQETLTFFLPMTVVYGAEAKEMLKKLHASKKNGYTISFQNVTTPIKGIKVAINYNAHKIMCDYQIFNAITGNKGIVFSFHNKEVLAKLKISTDPIMQYALNVCEHGKKPKIMLDIGHGGSDEGKVGCFNVQEKVINFQVGTKVAAYLKKAGYEVLLTRNNDCFVPLDQRTFYANKKKVDLFLSIHANAGSTDAASGIETYWLDSKLLKNCTINNHDTLKKLVVMNDTLSSLLAENVHSSVIAAAKKVYDVNDRKVRTSVTQVLLGTDLMMPSALIEVGFLSNQKETKLLMNNNYQMTLAQAIAEGIINYFKKCSVS